MKLFSSSLYNSKYGANIAFKAYQTRSRETRVTGLKQHAICLGWD